MYFPRYEQLIWAASDAVRRNPDEPIVQLPKKLFDFLLQAALTTADFDEDAYLASNPDIQARLLAGSELTAHQHFIGYGYFEGRRGGSTNVNEAWYLQTYPDVAAAVRSGTVKSAADHFYSIGACEGRSPSPGDVEIAVQWKKLFQR